MKAEGGRRKDQDMYSVLVQGLNSKIKASSFILLIVR